MELIKNHLEEYEVLNNIGSGSYGMVFRARNKLTLNYVAIKCFTVGNDLFKNYLNELKLIFRLSNNNIVKVIDVCSIEIYHYIIYEYMNEGNLRDKISQNEIIKIKEVVKIIKTISEALDYIHSNNIAHRDIKPENILINKIESEYIYKLCDFGVSKYSPDNDELTTNIGTPAYMSPEQFRGAYDKRSDLYSLGIIFYELIYGKRPFTGSLSDIMNAHLYQVPELEKLDTDPYLINIIGKFLEKNKDLRYQTGKEIIADLEKLDIKDEDLTKNHNIKNIELYIPTEETIHIRDIEKSSMRNLGRHVKFVNMNENNEIIVINEKNAFIYNYELNIESFVNEKDITYLFRNQYLYYIKEKSLIRVKKPEVANLKTEIFKFTNNPEKFYHDHKKNTLIAIDNQNKVYIFDYENEQLLASFIMTNPSSCVKSLLCSEDKLYIVQSVENINELKVYDFKGNLLNEFIIEQNFLSLQEDNQSIYLNAYDLEKYYIYKLNSTNYELFSFNLEQPKLIDIKDDKYYLISQKNKMFLLENKHLLIGKTIDSGEIIDFLCIKYSLKIILLYKYDNCLKLISINIDGLFHESD